MHTEPLLQMTGIMKEFPGVKALDKVDFTLLKGEIHALLGENGAGKSTLMKVLSGVYKKDGGDIYLDGQPVEISGPRQAQSMGIGIIHQELNLVPALTVMENIFLGREPKKLLGFVDRQKMYQDTSEVLNRLGSSIQPDAIVEELSIGSQQMVEIAKALSYETRILIMDEPTAALTEHESEHLFKIVRQLAASGVGIVYISHRMEELFALSNRITVMRDGTYVGSVMTKDTTFDQLVKMMVGRELTNRFPKKTTILGEEVIRIHGVCRGRKVEMAQDHVNTKMQPRDYGSILRKLGPLLGFIVLCLMLAVVSEQFLTVSNLLNVTRQVSINAIIAVGMTLVILTGGIDLSVGSIVAISGSITAGLMVGGMGSVPAILAGLLLGTFIGVMNGLLVSYGKIPPFIATMGMMTIVRGYTLVYTDGRPITGFSEGFRDIGSGYVGIIPIPVIIMILIFIGAWLLLKKNQFGRYVYAIGGNEEAARLSGINTKKHLIGVYGIAGLLAAVSGIILTSRLNSAQPTAGMAFEMDAIAAVVLGGTSLAGGRGTIVGTLVGALIIGVLDNGLNLLNVSSFYQQVAKGVVILLAVIMDRKQGK